MNKQDFSTAFLVSKPVKEVFEAINNVTGWWTENLKGSSKKLDDEFEVQFGDVHYSKQKLTDVIPGKKISWLVTDSKLNFIKDESEWTGTRIIFEVTEQGDKTQVRFTQIGLVPEVECYNACSNAWNDYLHGSLRKLIETGKGKPTLKEQKVV